MTALRLLTHMAISLSVFTGCAGGEDSRLSEQNQTQSTPLRSVDRETAIDAGVFFLSESSYYCVRLECLGIDERRKIVSIASSCNCIRPKIVNYAVGNGTRKTAIRLDIPSDEMDTKPVALSVVITVRFADLGAKSFSVKFLQTTFEEVIS